MHRHGYQGRKFGRETDQRRALLRGLTRSLIQHQSITTTLAKAKELRISAEKLITLAKKGDLASRRLVIQRLDDQTIGSYLVDIIAPQIKRTSGYLRIQPTGYRTGDHTAMATISFVDEIKPTPTKTPTTITPPPITASAPPVIASAPPVIASAPSVIASAAKQSTKKETKS